MDVQIRNFLNILKLTFEENKDIALEEPVDWNVLSEMARKQNLLPLFFETASIFEGYGQSEVYAKDQLASMSIVASQIQRSNAFLETYEKITARGIEPIVMKGIVCRQLYRELGEHRPSGDEDILVPVKDFYKVREILEAEDFVCEHPEITEKELNQIQEVSFYNREHHLHLEVHTNIIGKENEDRVRMNDLFAEAHAHGKILEICGIPVKVLEPTESFLFLILHAYKHFQNRGVGIRPILDILLYHRAYKDEIDAENLQNALKTCKAESFWLDVQYIGHKYLGLYEEMPKRTCAPEELLEDMIRSGVIGGRERSDFIAANVNLASQSDTNGQSKWVRLFRAVCPTKNALVGGYPYLEEKPWLLPAVWGKRGIKFIRYAGKDVWKLSSEILQKSSARMEIINKYKK